MHLAKTVSLESQDLVPLDLTEPHLPLQKTVVTISDVPFVNVGKSSLDIIETLDLSDLQDKGVYKRSA